MEDLRFDFDRGIVYRFKKKYNTYEVARNKHPNGYIYIKINNKRYCLHRVLYEKYHNIKLKPDEHIDHINGIRDDNKITNLRIATNSQNIQNTKCRNQLGHKHIYLHYGYYRVLIRSYKFKSISKTFKTLDEAINFRNNQYRYLNETYDCFYQMSSSSL
jgi:hypothetical protein